MHFIERLLAQEPPRGGYNGTFRSPAQRHQHVAMRGFCPLASRTPRQATDDDARQVSWLAGSALSPVFPGKNPSDIWVKALRRQLRGQPWSKSHVPYTLHLPGL